MNSIRTTALSIAFLLALELNVTPTTPGPGIPTDFVAGVQLAEGSYEAGRLVDWAVASFEAAGLGLHHPVILGESLPVRSRKASLF